MRAVKTLQRYKCDFCNFRSTKQYMKIHEKRCFRNPNRYCDFCDNKGYVVEHENEIGTLKHDCPYCSSFDKEKLKAIEEREEKERNENNQNKT